MNEVKQDITFEVKNISKAEKKDYVCVDVKFHDGEKIYQYIRRSYPTERTYIRKFVIDGVEVKYDRFTFVTLNYKRIGETVSRPKRDTSGVSGKIKAEIEKKDLEIQIPEVKEETKVEVKTDGIIRHDKFEQIKACVSNQIPVYLVGPAGAGKNHTLEQISKDLGINFYFTNSVQQEYQLTGFVDAGGNYHDTQFYRACKEADQGINTMFFLDEMDASIPEVLVKLNMAIAQGYFEFPNGEVLYFGEHIHWVAAGNTFGNGADEMYTGRMVLDQASLDRFVVISFDYCLAIELHITKGNADLVNFIRQLRKEATERGIRATFSYRCLTMVTKLEGLMDLEEVLRIAVFKGMDKDTVNTFSSYGTTKYHTALRRLRMVA